MTENRLLSFAMSLCCLVLAISLMVSCASIGPGPQGGPKDSIPPKVLNMLPENLTRNFASKKVVITFDEYFKLNDQFKQFSISPDVEVLPTLRVRGKTLEIEFTDTLESNTTYTLNFGKSIVDVNEGNSLKNFSYVFSTGPQLDSLTISGNIRNAQTGKPEIEAAAILIPFGRDTLFEKKKASIYALTDSSGNYKISNLREGKYHMYALKEQSSDKIYQQSTDEVGFVKDPIVLTKDTQQVNMLVFKETAETFRVVDRRLNTDGTITMNFNQELDHPGVTIIEPANLDATKKYKFSSTGDSVKVWLTDLSFDSTKVSITNGGQLLQTVKFNRGKKETYTRSLIAADNLEGNLLNPNHPLIFNFGFPIESVNPSRITLTEDSVKKTDFKLEKDSSNFLAYKFIYPWRPGRIYEIKADTGAFASGFDTRSKIFTKKFELAKKDDYGTLKVKILTPEPNKQYLLEITNENKNVVSRLTVNQDTTVSFTNYRAGKYFIRIVYDTNKNGKWDTGNYKKGVYPEKIFHEPKELSIRANWDRNETITLPKEN